MPFLLTADQSNAGMVDLGRVTLLTKPLAMQHSARVVARAAGGRLDSVLIADDDGDVRRILAETLSAAGCRIDTAVDGSEAVTRLAASPPTVLVVDLLLAGADAIFTLARLRADPELRDTPVVAMLPAELSAEESARLEQACRTASNDSTLHREPLAELIRDATGAAFEGAVGD